MACVELGPLDFPEVPAPFGFQGIALEEIQADVALCCKLKLFSLPPITIIPAAALNPGVIAALNVMIAAMESYTLLQPLSCPLED